MSSRSKKKWKNRMRTELPPSAGPVLENLQEADNSAEETAATVIEEEPQMVSSDCKNYEVQQSLVVEKKNEDTSELIKEILESKEALDTARTVEILEDTKNAVATKEPFNAVVSIPEKPEAGKNEPEKSEPEIISPLRPFETKIIETSSAAERVSRVERVTKETKIVLELNLDGTGKAKIDTGIGFFDHMLVNMTKHGFLDMKLSVQGDLFVDGHHTIEDTGIVFGQALREALGTKEGIKRYGSFLLPMDETLVLCAVDLSGRPYLNFSAKFTTERVGYMETELVKEFFYAVSYSSGMNLHIKVLDGQNNHHIIEAMFKAFAKALDEAKTIDPRISGVLSTKGVV